MKPENSNLEKVIWQKLIEGERARDLRFFWRKLYDDIAHSTEVLLERFSSIK